jgi:NAD+-dependent protein deacetylase SIR2
MPHSTGFPIPENSKAHFNIPVYNSNNATAEVHKKIREISTMSSAAYPTAFHGLLADLAQDDRLLRFYTQDIDCIDTRLPGLATAVPLPDYSPWPRTV